MSRMFPILEPRGRRWIPWSLLAPHEKQAQLNHAKTLEQLVDRDGGLCPSEAIAIIEDRKWAYMSPTETMDRLDELVKQSCPEVQP